MSMARVLLTVILASLLATAVASVTSAAPPGAVNQAHDGWPVITGMLLINRNDLDRPLDARPDHDPFGGQDARYSCDGERSDRNCAHRLYRCDVGHGRCVRSDPANNELLGGHGNDTIHGGPWRDVLWGDYKPSGQPLGQFDRLNGNGGRDHIYASHGWNTIKAGPGNDFVKTHYGRGVVDCGKGRDTLWTTRRNLRAHRYRIRRCERVRTGHSPATRNRLRYR
jgi:hemolysin type calcium-binding protein